MTRIKTIFPTAGNEKSTDDLYADLDSFIEQEFTKAADTEAATLEDTLAQHLGEDQLLPTIYPPLYLTKLVEESAELRQVVAAVIANTVGYGYRFVQRDAEDENVSEDVLKNELIELENFCRYINPDQDLTGLLVSTGWDFYLTGNSYYEVTRDARGKPNGIYRVPSYQTRATRQDKRSTSTKMKRIHQTRDGYKIKIRQEAKRFRRFAQAHLLHSQDTSVPEGSGVWYKEFQDKRVFSRQTGTELLKKSDKQKAKRENDVAHELVHVHVPNTRGVYGFPYHIGNLISIEIDKKAEQANYSTLINNNIPSMLISVAGGNLTPGSVARIKKFVSSKFQRSDNRSRFLIIESNNINDDDEDTGKSKIHIQSLHDARIDDVLYEKLSNECRAMIRRSFRIPEILVGRGEGKTGKQVEAEIRLVDQQVFSQDRALFMDWINRKLLPELGIVHHEIHLNTPNITDTETLIQMIRDSEKSGAMSPSIARTILEMILSRKLPELSKDIDPNVPFSLQMAEAVKKINDAGANNPTGSSDPEKVMNDADQTEIAQQVTSDSQS